MINNQIANDLRAAIAAMIPTGDGEVFKFASAWPISEEEVQGYPAVIVTPSENQADYGSTAENKLSFVFDLMIYYPILADDREKTERAIGTAMGELLKIFSQKAGVPGTIYTRPVPSVWGEEPGAARPYRTCRVILTCVTYPLVG